MIELVYRADVEATSFAIRAPDDAIRIEPDFSLPTGERLVPYSASNDLIASRCVRLPADVAPFAGKAELLRDLRAFISRYVDLDPVQEDIAAHYVLLSWVNDAFSEVPYLRFQGAFGSGKTRALLVVGELCYKAFLASGASTVSPIFHILDRIGSTLVLDEADARFSDATADLTKILNNGTTKGLRVLRTMPTKQGELSPKAFNVFGPKLIAMRGAFEDDALESRLITIVTGRRKLRRDIPLSLPDAMRAEALALRNRLLGWRFAAFGKVSIEPGRAIPSLTPRGNQMALPLFALIDDENLRHAIAEELAEAEELTSHVRNSLPEVRMVRILAQMAGATAAPYIPLSALRDAYNEGEIGSSVPSLSFKSAGWLVRRKLGLRTVKTRGVYVIPGDQWDKVARLAVRYGIEHEPAAGRPQEREETAEGSNYTPSV
ncbi:MAG TPA: hypothetical protein VMG08_16205 [Allosphingosinicella sp.]|nr:hypothetical protein [Allosphingosinicella sp.]